MTELRSLAVVGGLRRLGLGIVMAALESAHFTEGVLCIVKDYGMSLKKEDLDNIARIESLGGKVLALDISKSRSETVKALTGIHAVVSFQPTEDEFLHEIKALIDDCISAGVKRFIPNVFGVDYTVNDLPWLPSRREIHHYLEERKVSIEHTEIMNGYFADVSNLSYPGILGIDWEAKVAKYTGSGSANSKISFTFRKDVADLVVLALQNPSISANKILRLYERASGVTFEKLPVDESAVSTGPLMADDFDWSDDNAIGPFAKMALRGSAVVNPNGENVDNSLFPQWNPMNMESQAALVWKWAQTL